MRLATPADIPTIKAIIGEAHGADLDPTALISDLRTRCYFDERGGALFAWRGPGIYEGHSFFVVRGREALKAGREALSLMADARMIWGLTPESRREVRWFNRQLGFKSHGLAETPEGACELFVLES